MNAAIGQLQDMATTGNQEHMNLKEESNMKTKSQISKWINSNTTVKMVAGLALGAVLMTAIVLPSNAFADTPKRPMTSEEQLVIMAEIEDGAYDTGFLTPMQQLVVRAEIEDGALGFEDYKRDQVGVSRTGAVGLLQAVLSHDEGSVFLAEEWLQIIAEIEDAV